MGCRGLQGRRSPQTGLLIGGPCWQQSLGDSPHSTCSSFCSRRIMGKGSGTIPTAPCLDTSGSSRTRASNGLPSAATAAVVRSFKLPKQHKCHQAQTLSPSSHRHPHRGMREEGCSSIPARLTLSADTACIGSCGTRQGCQSPGPLHTHMKLSCPAVQGAGSTTPPAH